MLTRSQNYIRTVNVKDNQFVIVFPIFYDKIYRRKKRMKTFRFPSRLKKSRSNIERPHKIILIKTTSRQPFADVLQNRCS